MRSIVVTGASSGIGAALARRAAAHGWAVLAVARRGDRLEALVREIVASGGRCEMLVADVLWNTAPQTIVDRAVRAFDRLDVVVNNAGAAHASNLLEESDAEIDRQLQLHVAAPLRIARAALPHIERGHGGLVFFGSGLARVPAPGYGAYAPAKAAIRAATIQLRRELHGRGVFVTYVDPGVVDTEFSLVAGMEERPAWWHAKPDAVAAAVLRGIEHRASHVNAVPWQTAATAAGEWLPGVADRAMANFVAPPVAAIERAQPVAPTPPPPSTTTFDAALSPLQRRMERIKLPVSFVRTLLIPQTTIDLNDAAMRWAGMPNKNERAAMREVLDALAQAGFLEPSGAEGWRVLRGPN
jgi:short-subunit dehydrogenase